jgi:hypothetical protein
MSHQPPSHSSQTYTGAPSGTGHGASGQSVTVATENFDPIFHEATFAHQSVIFYFFSFFLFSSRVMMAIVSSVWKPLANFLFRHRQVLSPDQQDFSLAGFWAPIEPRPDTFVIENEPILSPIHRAGAAVNSTRQGTQTTARVGNGNTDDAVRILRASLHREV